MRRGNILRVAAPRDYGKPRPAVLIQSGLLSTDAHSTIVALMTSDLLDAPLLRPTILPAADNGLKAASQVQLNRLLSLPKPRVGGVIGRLSDNQISELNRLLAVVIGLA